MPVINSIADLAPQMAEWRRWLHQNPEIDFACHKTARFVADRLAEFGVDEIHEGIAQTGVVAIINGQGAGPTIGLRADMDALPMSEQTGADWSSHTPGAMHACGHDGHTTMLLGAAKYLAETRRFKGRVALIFQPAEEGSGGGRVMVEEGVMDRFEIAQVYALHNGPGVAAGAFWTTPGPIMAAADEFQIEITGEGGHAATPEQTRDPIPAALAIASAIQTISSRNLRSGDGLVISITQINAGTASNIVPTTATLGGTVRSFAPEVRNMVERRLAEIVAGQAAAFGVEATCAFIRGYPPTVNHAAHATFAADVATQVVGEDNVARSGRPEMAAEDFAYMLEARPGAYLYIGNGDSAGLHHPAYDFNDAVAPVGASFFARLVETAQPL
jgi:hippurate hydrolase